MYSIFSTENDTYLFAFLLVILADRLDWNLAEECELLLYNPFEKYSTRNQWKEVPYFYRKTSYRHTQQDCAMLSHLGKDQNHCVTNNIMQMYYKFSMDISHLILSFIWRLRMLHYQINYPSFMLQICLSTVDLDLSHRFISASFISFKILSTCVFL